MKKSKKPTVQEARRAKAATAVSEAQNADGITEKAGRSDMSTPQASTLNIQAKLKEINRQTSPEAILEAFPNQDMTKKEWEKSANQVLTRGIQKTAEEVLTSRDAELGDDDVHTDTPPEFSDESSKDEHQAASHRLGGVIGKLTTRDPKDMAIQLSTPYAQFVPRRT